MARDVYGNARMADGTKVNSWLSLQDELERARSEGTPISEGARRALRNSSMRAIRAASEAAKRAEKAAIEAQHECARGRQCGIAAGLGLLEALARKGDMGAARELYKDDVLRGALVDGLPRRVGARVAADVVLLVLPELHPGKPIPEAPDAAALGRLFPAGCGGIKNGPGNRSLVSADQCRPAYYFFSLHVNEVRARHVSVDPPLERTMRTGNSKAMFMKGQYYHAVNPNYVWRDGMT